MKIALWMLAFDCSRNKFLFIPLNYKSSTIKFPSKNIWCNFTRFQMIFFWGYFSHVLKYRSRLIYALCCRSDTGLTTLFYRYFFFRLRFLACLLWFIWIFYTFMLAFVPKMVRCEWILVDILECKSPKKKSFTSKEVLGIDLLTLLTLYWDVHFNYFIFVKKNMTTKHVVTDEYTN